MYATKYLTFFAFKYNSFIINLINFAAQHRLWLQENEDRTQRRQLNIETLKCDSPLHGKPCTKEYPGTH